MIPKRISELAKLAGVNVHEYCPGDGVRRFRICPVEDCRGEYFACFKGHTVLGKRQAEMFLAGFIAGLETGLKRAK